MIVLSIVAIAAARHHPGSRGWATAFATIRDDELAAEACGVRHCVSS